MSVEGPVEQTERAAAESAVRFVLDGLKVNSLQELKHLVDLARWFEHAQAQIQNAGVFGFEADVDGPVLGKCAHGVDLDREFCPHGCRI